MSTIDTTFLRASKEAIASPTDYPQSPLSQALRQPVLLGLFLPIHHGGWSSSNLPRTTEKEAAYQKVLCLFLLTTVKLSTYCSYSILS